MHLNPLNEANYLKGFLIDEELMAGVTAERPSGIPDPMGSGGTGAPAATQPAFIAFVLRHSTGEYLGYQRYSALSDALAAINRIPRDWTYEQSGGCGGGECATGKCGKGSCGTETCPGIC